MPDAPIHTGRMHLHEDLVVSGRGFVDLLESQDVLGFAVLVLDDCLHRPRTVGHKRSLSTYFRTPMSFVGRRRPIQR